MLCCARVWRGSLDYELSGEQEAQQWGGSPHDAALSDTRQRGDGGGFGARIKTSDKTPRGATNVFHSHVLSRRVRTTTKN